MKRRQGFTIVEVVVAIVLLAVGILGLVTTAALVTRMMGRGTRASKAAVLAQQRIEILRATPCASLAGGADTVGAFTRQWTVTTSGNARRIQVIVRYVGTPGKLRADTTATTMDCTP